MFLLPRGAAGRTPTVAQTNLRVAARKVRLTLSLDVLNAFHRRGVTAVDELYVLDPLAPIAGGDETDLVFAKDNVVEGAPARVNRRYGAPSRFQAPVLVVVGDEDAASRPTAHALAAALPDARLEVIPGAGHVVNLAQDCRCLGAWDAL